jgi:acyl-CoA thioesterase
MKFHEVLATLHSGAGEWTAEISGDWAQGRTTFGGMQVALAARAMRGALHDPGLPLRSLQATFVGPLAPGRVRLRTELLRTGRSASHVHCGLLQASGELACTLVGIFGAARPSSFVREIPRPSLAVSPESLPDMQHTPGVMAVFQDHLQVRWAVGTPPYSGYHEPRTVIFARFRERGCTGEEALIALADIVPTPVLSMLRAPAPASSLNWTLELLGDPAAFDLADWSLIDTEVRAGVDGYLSQTSVLWGSTGHAFSVSHQTVAIFA